jgi:hypothetical protein
MSEISINYLAVLVAAAANMAVGSLWYGPIFGKLWMRLEGFTRESMKSMSLTASQAMVGGVVTALLMAYVLAHFVELLGIVDMGGVWQLAFWIWLGLAVPASAEVWLWGGKSYKLFLLNAARWFATLLAMISVLSLW